MTSCGLKQKLDQQRHNVDCGRAHMSRVVATSVTSDGRLDGDGTPGISLENCYSWRWTRGPAERVPVVDCWIDEVLLQRANKEIRLANKYRSSPACRQVLYEKYLERPAGGDCSWWADGLTAHGKRTLFEVQRKKAAKSQLHQHRTNSTPLPSWTMSWKNMYRYSNNNNNKYFSSSTQPSRPSSSVSTTDKSRSRRPMSAV